MGTQHYRAGKSVMKSSGTSSCKGTGKSGWWGQVISSSSIAVRTQISILKYCMSSVFCPFCILEVEQTGHGTYCSMSSVPSLSVAVRAKKRQRNIKQTWNAGVAAFTMEILKTEMDVSVPTWCLANGANSPGAESEWFRDGKGCLRKLLMRRETVLPVFWKPQNTSLRTLPSCSWSCTGLHAG